MSTLAVLLITAQFVWVFVIRRLQMRSLDGIDRAAGEATTSSGEKCLLYNTVNYLRGEKEREIR